LTSDKNRLLEIEERLMKTETSLAHVEDFLVKTQEEAHNLWKEIEKVKRQNTHLENKIKELEEFENLPHARPPHY
ncbi:MAG TPA: SlyX family protein, partial [Treponemataceae bacterium]|nr:SlyX family protein [Treponemataceae bacterium]